ncbi:hypothetical protein DFH08DRAFT_1021681 [Mycena albidolilacea]|uniref:Uncharacterized protein n=1 Tax=Mycena albidolilacea TaxID=1033008 RepID=A0AAD6ZPR7_9AGAR|nr:hypothetical protein DFH08DRAFT_1021681 [Mycena albidolilacea]
MASAWNVWRRHYAYLVTSPHLPVLTILVHVPVCVLPAPKAHHSRFRIALPRSSHPASISPKALASCYACFARVRHRRVAGMPVLRPLSGCPSLCAPVCARPHTPRLPSHSAPHAHAIPARPSVLATSPRRHLHTATTRSPPTSHACPVPSLDASPQPAPHCHALPILRLLLTRFHSTSPPPVPSSPHVTAVPSHLATTLPHLPASVPT